MDGQEDMLIMKIDQQSKKSFHRMEHHHILSLNIMLGQDTNLMFSCLGCLCKRRICVRLGLCLIGRFEASDQHLEKELKGAVPI